MRVSGMRNTTFDWGAIVQESRCLSTAGCSELLYIYSGWTGMGPFTCTNKMPYPCQDTPQELGNWVIICDWWRIMEHPMTQKEMWLTSQACFTRGLRWGCGPSAQHIQLVAGARAIRIWLEIKMNLAVFVFGSVPSTHCRWLLYNSWVLIFCYCD